MDHVLLSTLVSLWIGSVALGAEPSADAMNRLATVGMLPNAVDVDENQARQLVHWILGFDR